MPCGSSSRPAAATSIRTFPRKSPTHSAPLSPRASTSTLASATNFPSGRSSTKKKEILKRGVPYRSHVADAGEDQLRVQEPLEGPAVGSRCAVLRVHDRRINGGVGRQGRQC